MDSSWWNFPVSTCVTNITGSSLSKQKTASSLFIQSIRRAAKYRIFDMKTIESIINLQMTDGSPDSSAVLIDETFCDRQAYLDGQFGSEVDLSKYNNLWEDNNG